MRSFTDISGMKWELNVTTRTIKQVKERTGTLLTAIFDDDCKLLGELSKDVIVIVDILWCICENQANDRGVTEEQFAESLAGDSLGDAFTALTHSVADFFTSQEQREGLNDILTKLELIGQKVATSWTEKIKSIDADQLVTSSTDSASSSLESPAAIPGATR